MVDIVERLNDSLSAGYSELRKEAAVEITRLRARIEQMEKQEPVARFNWSKGKLEWLRPWNYSTMNMKPLYLAPGAQPAPSVPDVDALTQFIREIDGKHQLGAGALAERIVEWLAAAPETKPCGAQIGASVPVAALRPVIDWLRNGCDPMKAADELEMLTAAPEAKL